MADELNEQEGLEETRAVELESLLAQKDEELARVKARLTELEQTLVAKDSEVAAVKQSQSELEARLTTLNGSLAEAVTAYKTMVVQANPEVVAELVTGDTIESVNESLGKAKVLISKVKQGMEAEISLARVPAGAPERTLPDLSALSSREKIQYAIGGRK